MSDRHKTIRESKLEEQIKELFYEKKLSYRKIAEELNISPTAVYRFLREDKLTNFNDNRLEEISRSGEYNPLSLIDTFFDAAAFVAREMQFTALLAAKYREEVADIVSKHGIEALGSEAYKKSLDEWYRNSDKLMKLADRAPKQLEAYINLYTQVLDVQKEVSYVRVVTEILSKKDPELYRYLTKAMNEDPAARAVMTALEPTQIAEYWATSGTPGKAKKALVGGEDE